MQNLTIDRKGVDDEYPFHKTEAKEFQEKKDNTEVLNHIQIYTQTKIQKEQSKD